MSIDLKCLYDFQGKKMSENKVLLKTNKGEITIELDFEKAPVSSENFASYVRDGFFEGTIFHRVIPGFMVQGGGFTEEMTQKPTKSPIINESSNGLSNKRGTLAMARTSDPNSATAQFYINLVDNNFLDYADAANPGYAVFGAVVEGIDIIDEIAKVKTGKHGYHDDVPVNPVLIESASFI